MSSLDEQVKSLIGNLQPEDTVPDITNIFGPNPVYPGGELKVSKLVAGVEPPEDAAAARASKTLSRIKLGTPAEQRRDQQRVGDIGDLAIEIQAQKQMETTDALGFNKQQRQKLGVLGDDYVVGVDDKGQDVTVMRLRMGKYFQRSILESIIKSRTPEGATERYKPTETEIRQATEQARALSAEFPDDPKYSRALSDLYAGAKLLVIDLPLHSVATTQYIGSELVGKGVPRVAGAMANFLRGLAGYSNSKWADRQSKKEFSNFIKWNVEAAENFYSHDFGGIEGFNLEGITNAKVRPFIYNAFFANDLELTPQTAAIVYDLDNPGAGFYSHLLHIVATTASPTASISIARNLLMRGVGKRFKEFAADASKHSARLNAKGESQPINLDIIKGKGAVNAQEMKDLTREFLEYEARTAGAFRGEGKVRSVIDNIKTGRIQLAERRRIQQDLVRQEKLSREDPAAASLAGKTLTQTLKDRMKKAQAKQRDVYLDPRTTLQARKAVDQELRDIAFEQNLLGMGFGKRLQPTVRLLRNPQLRDEAKVESMFSFGAALSNEILKEARQDFGDGYKPVPWFVEMAGGFTAAMTLSRVVPARLAQTSSFLRDFAMNAEVMLRNKSVLAKLIDGAAITKLSPEEQAKRLGTIRLQAYNHFFSPQAQLKLDAAGGTGILRQSELFEVRREDGKETMASRLRGRVARATPDIVKTPYLTNRALRYSHIDKDGNWVKLNPDEKEALLNIADSIILSGRRLDILEVTQDSIEMDQAIRDLGGDPRKFNLLLARVLPMMGLMVFESTADVAVSGPTGALKVDALRQSIERISQSTEYVREVNGLIDNLFPSPVDPAARSKLVGEIITTTKTIVNLQKNNVQAALKNAQIELNSLRRRFGLNKEDFVIKDDPTGQFPTRVEEAEQQLKDIEKRIREIEEAEGISPTLPGVAESRQAAEDTINRAGELAVGAKELDTAFDTFAAKQEQVEAAERLSVRAMEGVSSGVDTSLEMGEVGSAILDLALRVQRTYRDNFKKQYDDFFDRLDADPKAVEVLSDEGFIERLLRAYYTRVAGQQIKGENPVQLIMREMKDNKTGSRAIRTLFGAVEKASKAEFERIFQGLKETDQNEVIRLLSGGDDEFNATLQLLRDNNYQPENGISNYLALTEVLGAQLPWTFKTLNDLRLEANKLGHSLNDDVLKDLSDQIRLSMERAMGKEAAEEFAGINDDYRVMIGDKFERSQIGKLVAQSVHLMGKEGQDVTIDLEKYFDLNNKLFGTETNSKEFVDQVKLYFGDVLEKSRPPREYTGPVRSTFGLDLNTKIINEVDGSVVSIGSELQKIIATLHHSALLKSKVFKNIDYNIEGWTTTPSIKERLIRHISGYDDDAAAAIESGARTRLFGDAEGNNSIIAGLGDMEYQASLLDLVEKSRALRGQLTAFDNATKKLGETLQPRLNAIENLSNRVIDVTIQEDLGRAPIKTLADFFNTLNRGIDDISLGSMDDYIANLSQKMNVSVEEIKQSLFSLFMQHASNHARGLVKTETDGIAKVLDQQKQLDVFAPETLEGVFEANERLLEKIIPARGVTVNKLNAKNQMEPTRLSPQDYLEELKRFSRLLRIYSENQNVTAPKNLFAHSVKSLSPSSIISRLYAINRGVVSTKYVITEAALIQLRKRKAKEMKAILENPDLMYHMNKILESRNILPPAENSAFLKALQRTIIHAEGEEIDPESSRDTILERLKNLKQAQEQNITPERDIELGPPYFYPENYNR